MLKNVSEMKAQIDFSNIVYIDNAATSFPKPPDVLEKATAFFRDYGVNPGRSGYDLARLAGELVDRVRLRLCRLFNGDDPNRLIFCYNATDALNLLLRGLLGKDDHVITTTLEHNSVIRPLKHLTDELGITVDFLPFESGGLVDTERIRNAIRAETRLVLVTHGSNVLGTVQPIADIGALCHEAGVFFAIDAAQTAGIVPIDVKSMHIDAVAFTGHKGLLGPTGVGGLYLGENMSLRPYRTGGTGVRSAELRQPEAMPYQLEAGTLNLLGIAGLNFSLDYIENRGIENIHQEEMALFAALQDGLASVSGVSLRSPLSMENRLPVLHFTIDGIDPEEVGTILDVDFGIAVRTGLHCAPLLHRQLGTAPRGSVRVSTGPFNTSDHIQRAIAAVSEITRSGI